MSFSEGSMVAIKMEMPRVCADCRFAHGEFGCGWFYCDAEGQFVQVEEKDHRQEWCPLVEVAAVAPVLPEKTMARKFR